MAKSKGAIIGAERWSLQPLIGRVPAAHEQSNRDAMSEMPCLHEHCRERTIYQNHRKINDNEYFGRKKSIYICKLLDTPASLKSENDNQLI